MKDGSDGLHDYRQERALASGAEVCGSSAVVTVAHVHGGRGTAGGTAGHLMHREVATLRQDRDALLGAMRKLRSTFVRQVGCRSCLVALSFALSVSAGMSRANCRCTFLQSCEAGQLLTCAVWYPHCRDRAGGTVSGKHMLRYSHVIALRRCMRTRCMHVHTVHACV